MAWRGLALGAVLVLAACADGTVPEPVAPTSPPASMPADQARPATAPPSATAGRLDSLRRYEASLLDLIAAIEADGVAAYELSDLARVQSRLHAARAEIVAVEVEAAQARLRLRALTGTLGSDPAVK